jgi:hypothetical protein
MRPNRAVLAALATTALYLVGTLIAGPVTITTQPQASPLAWPLGSVAAAAPASTGTAATPAAGASSGSGNSLQNPTESGGFGNSATTNTLTTPATPGATATTPSSDPNEVDQTTCAQKDGAFSWLFCPFFDGVSHTFADGAAQLISGFLAVQPLQQSGPIYETWNSLRLLADVLFVIIFLVIIFDLSSSTIKRMIPKLVASAVLVQFSFVLVSVIIDFGNILGAGVGQLIGSTVHGGATASFDLGTLTENLVGGGVLVALAAVAWEMAFPLFLMVLISVLAMILTLALRYVILGILIIVSPLAFAAWVLPNTERYFSTWLNTLIKLVLMYPIIIALLSLAANVDGLIPAAASTNPTVTSGITTTIIKVLVFVACFAAIPQTFKWAGGAMAQAHGAVDGMRKWGHKEVRESDNWKNKRARTSSRQIERANRIEAGLRPFLSSHNPLVKGAGNGMMTAGSILLAGRTGTSSAGRQRGSSQLVSGFNKSLEEMREATPGNMKNALLAHYGTDPVKRKAVRDLRQQGAESLIEFTSRIEGRQALVRRLADKNLLGRETMGTIQSHSRAFQKPAELQMVLQENGKNIRDNPAMFARYNRSDPSKTNVLGSPARIGDINPEAAAGFYSGLTASRFGSDFSIDNLKLMTDNKAGQSAEIRDMGRQAATVFGGNTSPSAIKQAFSRQGRAFAPADKRATLLEGMARNQAEFTSTPEGQLLWDAILDQIHTDMAADATSHADAYSLLDKADPTLRGMLGL